MWSIVTVLIVIALGLFLWMIFWGVFWFLVQAGVVVQKAVEPPTTDGPSFTLEQGREVKSEAK